MPKRKISLRSKEKIITLWYKGFCADTISKATFAKCSARSIDWIVYWYRRNKDPRAKRRNFSPFQYILPLRFPKKEK